MNAHQTERFGVFGVQERAKRYDGAARRRPAAQVVGDDAIPLRQKRKALPTAVEAEASARPASPYRVRDAAARYAQASARKRREAAPSASPPPEARGRPRRTANTAAGERRRGAAPDPRMNTDEIFIGGAERDERRREAYRLAQRKKAAYRFRRTSGIIVIMSALLLLVMFLVYKFFFVVKSITVSGTELYSYDEILAAAKLDENVHLYSFSSRVTRENITLHCPYVSDLDVTRYPTDTVHFQLTEDTAVFYADLYGEIRALSGTLRVLDPIDKEDAAAMGLIRLRLPAVEQAVAGRTLLFSEERYDRRIRDAVSQLVMAPLSERVTAVDLRAPYSLYVVCDGKYRIDFGDGEDMSAKLRIAQAVLSDSLFEAGIKADIDVSTTGSTSVILDDQIDLDA